MNEFLKLISDANIFKPGDIFILSENEERSYGPILEDFPYLIRSNEEVVRGIEFDVTCLWQEELKEFRACNKLSDLTFELILLVTDKEEEEGVSEVKFYIHRLLTTDEYIDESRRLYME